MMTPISKPIIKKQLRDKPDKHLKNAAAVLMEGFKSPAKLLTFISEALMWVDFYGFKNHYNPDPKNDNNDKSVYFLTMLLEYIVQPWFRGDDPLGDIAKGLKEIRDYGHYEGYQKNLSLLVSSFAFSLKDQESTGQHFEGISILFKVGFSLEKHEEYIKSEQAHKMLIIQNKKQS